MTKFFIISAERDERGIAMVDIIDVAAYILNKCGALSTMKLQKLCYYSQAFHLVRYGAPLFNENFEAWVNGPVARSLFNQHRGRFILREGDLGSLSPEALDDKAIESIDSVLSKLGEMDGASLSEMTHNELPWRNARRGLGPSDRCSIVIPKESIRDYYSNSSVQGNPLFAHIS